MLEIVKPGVVFSECVGARKTSLDKLLFVEYKREGIDFFFVFSAEKITDNGIVRLHAL